MEKRATTLDIVALCLQLDICARNIYEVFSDSAETPALSAFWKKICAEEAEHIEFWKAAIRIAGRTGLPEIIDSPDTVASELKKSVQEVTSIFDGLSQPKKPGPRDSFLLAYKIEFHALNPAFGLLFHILGKNFEGLNPETGYMSHIKSFGTFLRENSMMTPELELIDEALAHMWKESARMARQTIIDELTEAYNRRGFMLMAEQLSALARRNGSSVGIILMDLDHFKKINKELGHQAGDMILKQITEIIRLQIRTSDILGRYGGEEFAIFLPEVRKNGAALVAEKIKTAIAEANLGGSGIRASTGSLDSAISEDPGKMIWDLVKQAESLLYAAKRTNT